MDSTTNENADALTEREARLLARKWIDGRIEKPRNQLHSQTRSLLGELAKNCIAETLRNREGEDDLHDRLGVAWDIIWSVWYAAAPEYATTHRWGEDDQPDQEEGGKIEKAQHLVWQRRDPMRSFKEGFESIHYTEIDVRDLRGTIAMYLERPWLRCPSLDWIFVDMLISQELCAFGESIKQRSVPGRRDMFLNCHHRYFKAKGNIEKMTELNWTEFGEILWTRFFWTIAIPASTIAAAFHFEYRQTGWVFVGIYAFVILAYSTVKSFRLAARLIWRLLGKTDPRLKPFLLWDEMYEVWRRLEGPVVNPSRVREVMALSTSNGAVWPTPAWSLIDRVVAIDPAVWVTWPSRSYADL